MHVLFARTIGTGKTLAALVRDPVLFAVLARLDLAAFVSKYVGETERNVS